MRFTKDKDDRLDYLLNFSEWLGGDTIAGAVWLPPEVSDTLVTDDESFSPTTATVWVKGGETGKTYTLTCRITTAAGRVKDQSIQLKIKEA